MFGRNKWKKQYDESKFDLIDIEQFRTVSFKYVTGYFSMYISILIGMAVFASDIYTAVSLLAYDRWSSEINPAVPIHISRWIFAGCIILSTVIIIIEFIIAIRISRERNISRTYTNEIARQFYSIKGYNYFCLFGKITKSRNKKEYLALFVYFALKGWVRLVLADGPRQVINALTLYSVLKVQDKFVETLKEIATHSQAQALVIAGMLFSLVVWLFNIFQLIFALLCALPLYIHIQKTCSGLEEYCYVRINKRIAELVKKYHDRDLMELREENKRRSKQPTLPVFLNHKDSNATLVDSHSTESKTNLIKKSDTEIRSYTVPPVGDFSMHSQRELDPAYDPFDKSRQYRAEADPPKRKAPERFPVNPVQRKPVGSTTNAINNRQIPPRSTTVPPGRNLTGISSATQLQNRPAQSNNQRIFDQTQPSYSVNNLPKPSDCEPRSKTAPLPKQQQAQATTLQQHHPTEPSKPLSEYSVNNLPNPSKYAPRSQATPPQRQPANTPVRPQEYNPVEPSYSVHNLPKPSDYNARSQTTPLPRQQSNTPYTQPNQTTHTISTVGAQQPAQFQSASQSLPQQQQYHNKQFSAPKPISSTLPHSPNPPTPDNAFSPQMAVVSNSYNDTTRSNLSTSLSTTQGDFNIETNYYSDQGFNMPPRSNTDPTLQQTINSSYTASHTSRSVTVPPTNFNSIDPAKQEGVVNPPGSIQTRLVMQVPTNTPMSENFELSSNSFETMFPNQPDYEKNEAFSASTRSLTVPPELQTNYEGSSNKYNGNNSNVNDNIVNNQSSVPPPPLPLSREDFSSSSYNSQSSPFMPSTLERNEINEPYASTDVPSGSVATGSFYSGGDFNGSTSTLLASNDHYHDHATDIFALYYPSEAIPALVYNADLALTLGTDSNMSQDNDKNLFKLPYPDDVDNELEEFLSANPQSLDEKKLAAPYQDYADNDGHKLFEERARPNGVLPYPETDIVEELIKSTQYLPDVAENNNGDYNVQMTTNHNIDNGRLNNNGINVNTNINFSNGNPGISEKGSSHPTIKHLPYPN
jgi:hypothetical protein